MENIRKKQTIISKDKALEYGVHFGLQPRRWNPAMKPFIHSTIKGRNREVHIIDLNKTLSALEFSYRQVSKIAEKGGTFLFVGINKASSQTIKENAIRTGSYYVDHRWLGGTLTNFKTIQNSINRLRTLERLQKDNFRGYTKKEGLEMQRELYKLERSLGGIRFMRNLPSALIVTSLVLDHIAIKEAKKLGIPVFGIANTNTNPTMINFPIPANDISTKSVSIIITTLADAIASAKGDVKLVANIADDKVKVLGVPERIKEDVKDVLSKAKRSNVARNKAEKIEKVEERKTVKIRTDHNKEVIEKDIKQKEDYNKWTVVELKKLLKAKDIKFNLTDKKADLIKLVNKI